VGSSNKRWLSKTKDTLVKRAACATTSNATLERRNGTFAISVVTTWTET
jgi:hypothetical protein